MDGGIKSTSFNFFTGWKKLNHFNRANSYKRAGLAGIDWVSHSHHRVYNMAWSYTACQQGAAALNIRQNFPSFSMSHCLDGLDASSSWHSPAVIFTQLFRDKVGIGCCRNWERCSLGSRGSSSWVAAGKDPEWGWHAIPWGTEAAVERKKGEDIPQISYYSEEYMHFWILVTMWKFRVYLNYGQFLPFLYAIVSVLNFVPRDRKVNRDFVQHKDCSIQKWQCRKRKPWQHLLTLCPIWNKVSQGDLNFPREPSCRIGPAAQTSGAFRTKSLLVLQQL